MNRRLMYSGCLSSAKSLRLLPVLAGLVWVISGCASRQPAPVRIQPAKVLAQSGAGPDIHLRLVTYNIWGLPGWMTGARGGRYPQIARELEHLDPDVILLQEAWTAGSRRAIPTNGVWSIARAQGQHTFFQQSGLVTLSKLPILGGEFYPFSRAAYPDRFVNKGVLKVTVQMPGGQVLNIWNVHMQDGRATAVRNTQVRELIARVQAAEDGQVADLIGGDFNCTPESPLCRELVSGLGPTLQQLGGGKPFATWDGLSQKPGAAQTIDHVFLRERATFKDLQANPQVVFTASKIEQRLSDHLGIEAEVNLSPAAGIAGETNPSMESAPFPGILAHRAP